MLLDKIDMSVLESVRKSFNQSDIFFMVELIKKMYKEKPYQGLSIFYNAHMTLSSILQIEALVASGADVTVTCKPGLRCDPEVVEILKSANIPMIPLQSIDASKKIDVAIDCSSGFLETGIVPKYGVIELTQTGVVKYKNEQLEYPVISIDDTEIKQIETHFGTGDGFIRGFHKLTKSGLHNKKFVIVGYGKVGMGMAKALSHFTNQVVIIENDPNKVAKSDDKTFPIYDILDRANVVRCLNDAYCVATATGVKDVMSKYFDKGIIRAKYLVNMGSEDEWGNKFATNEILNDKLALNFCLKFPTQLRLLDPIFYAQLVAIDILLQQKLDVGVQILPAEIQLPIVSRWILKHHQVSVSGDYFEQILHNIPGFIYWKDRDSVYQGCNASFALAAGLTAPSEIIGKTDYELAWGEAEADVYRNGDQAAFEGESLLNFEETQLQADGRQKTVLASKIPFRDEEENIIGVLGIYSDISDTKERERLEIENRSHKAVTEAQEEFRKVVGQMVHDIRQPLASLQMTVSSTKEIPEEKRIVLRDSTIAITDITSQLLRQYEPENKATVGYVERQIVLVSTIITDVVGDRRRKYKDLPVRFKYDITQLNAFLFIKADISDFKRAISNILTNAVEALPKTSGTIDIRLSANEEWVSIRVIDDGVGIPEEVLNRINNKDVITHGKKGGHGIGLAQIRGMVEANYGEFDIVSSTHEKSHGTTINLRFPKVRDPDWIAEEVNLRKDDIVVILDDDKGIHGGWDSRLGHIMEKVDTLNINHFFEGQEALDFIGSLSAAGKERVCFLSDYELIGQKLNGLEVITKSKIKRSILVTSHYANIELRKNSLENKVRILPKDLVHLVPIHVVQALAKGELINVHMVFVDDEKSFTKTLIARHYSHLIVDSYSNPLEFLDEVGKYPLDTRFILDNYYYMPDGGTYKIDGVTMAQKLHAQGFTKLVMLSGEQCQVPEYLTLVLKTDQHLLSQLDKI